MNVMVDVPCCMVCGIRQAPLLLDADKVLRWRQGELVQSVWPDMSADQRELLISGTHPTCWDAMWDEEGGE